MSGSLKTLVGCTAGGLVAVSAYSAALGSSGWLWFFWTVLLLTLIGALVVGD
ncbi:hypothetical protein G5C51_32800 [Streptomyces sp. A7024]|uniref:Integral membrane protein n=1 Tax=Streptomyces coryli TaxID=1128680 RepID=A0A6G4UBF5_9ACTN|nr:hypothetical protein [Streptomyces coryli]NGN68657.1 hypothetical protein [Streptomyces coryli]